MELDKIGTEDVHEFALQVLHLSYDFEVLYANRLFVHEEILFDARDKDH